MEERRTDFHSYGNRRHIIRAFADDECEIPDTLLCVKRWFNAQEETLTLSGTQGTWGEHCAQISYRKIACAVVCPSQTARQLASATYSRDSVICIWPIPI